MTAARLSEPDEPESAQEQYDVVVIGSGFSGICMGIKLLEAGIRNFVILERAGEIGGTWRDNNYPGCCCDIPSHLYSYSFETRAQWSKTHAGHAEIQDYLLYCVNKYGLGPYMRFDQNVAQAKFDEQCLLWRIDTLCGERFTTRALVSGIGGLSRPSMAAIPGLEKFDGKSFHSANWDHAYDLRGKNVAVIGTGASAIQFVPKIVDEVKTLSLFQRTPPWIVPKMGRPIRAWEKWLFHRIPFSRYVLRNFYYWRQEYHGIAFIVNPRLMRRAEKVALKYLHASISDEKLRQQLIPNYQIGCKRILISDDYYSALKRSNLKFLPVAVDHFNGSGLTDADGNEHQFDAIIFATGFHATDPLTPMRIFGVDNRELSEDCCNGPQAYLGISVSGYPNLFLLMGPNTGLGHNSVVFMIESQVRYTIGLLKALLERPQSALDVKANVQQGFNERLQRDLEGTVWSSGCKSWYQSASGRHCVLWPGFTFSYWLKTYRPRLTDFNWLKKH